MEKFIANNINDEELFELPELVERCNIYNCRFGDTTNTTFDGCNIENCIFTTKAILKLSNVINCKTIDELSFEEFTVDKSNIIEESEENNFKAQEN